MIGILVALAMLVQAFRGHAKAMQQGMETEPMLLFVVKNFAIAGMLVYLTYLFASYRGLPNVLVIMGLLIVLYSFRHHPHHHRPAHLRARRQREGRPPLRHQHRAAGLPLPSSTWACSPRSPA